MLRVALIGCGDVSTHYVEGFKGTKKAVLSMVMDKELEFARKLGTEYSLPFTDDLERVLADPAIDAVIVAVPHYLHAPLTIRAAEAGKHVLCDKPISTTAADARSMIRACRSRRVKLGVNYAVRYRPLQQKAKQLVGQGVLGKIHLVQFHGIHLKPEKYWTEGWKGRVKTDWRAKKALSGGGVSMMNFSHSVDLFRYLTGLEFVSVKGEYDTFETPVEVEDTVAAAFRFDNGAIGSLLTATWTGPIRESMMRIFGSDGTMEFRDEEVRLFTKKSAPGVTPLEWTVVSHELQSQEGYGPYLDLFADAVAEDKDPPVTGEDALTTLEVVLGIYTSSDTGKTVRLKHRASR